MRNCLNCEHELHADNKFCPACGQEVRNLKISFWEFVTDFLSSNFNFDTKLGRTVKDLVFRPGRISKEYNSGKRIRYVKPLRLYFFISFVFFLLMNFSTKQIIEVSTGNEKNLATSESLGRIEIELDSTSTLQETLKLNDLDDESEVDSLIEALGKTPTPLRRHLLKQVIRAMNAESQGQIVKEYLANLSVSMFFLMPVFALFVWLFTKKESPFYLNALVFSIHFHSMAFLLFIVDQIIGFTIDSILTTILFALLNVVLLIFWLKNVYNLSLGMATGKTLGVSMLYLISLFLVMLFNLLLSFLLF